MGFYKTTYQWRIILLVIAIIIVAASVFYTNYLVKNIKSDEKLKLENFINAFKFQTSILENDNNNCDVDLSLPLNIMENINIPLILVTENGEVREGRNFGEEQDYDVGYLTQELNKIQKSGQPPMQIEYMGFKEFIYFKDSKLIILLKYFPLVMFLLVSSFILIGYWGFRSEKNAEQNRVWAGLAKETAHQLGTPISGMVAWLEHLRLMKSNDGETMEIVDELEKDVDRLMLVADRFSKIGSKPELKEEDLIPTVHNIFKYMERRAPKRVVFSYPQLIDPPKTAKINQPLFEWVLENLLRNALDASGNKGKISSKLTENEHNIYIDISDTGKGIPESRFNSIFKPGFTTKKRGWGLGLSLAKRIIESYHSGKIFVKESTMGKGTTFRIQLPKK